MNAKEFYDRFIKLVVEDEVYDDQRKCIDIYKNDEPTFTKMINKKIVPKIIREAGYVSQNEYFRIDTIGWETKYEMIDKNFSKELGVTRHLWDLKIAVEHENSKSDWIDEVVKLAHIRCPLKVVIGYVHCDEREEIEQRKLEYAHWCLKNINAFDPKANEEFLIIFGNGAPRHKGNGTYSKFDYRGYVLKKGYPAFEKIGVE